MTKATPPADAQSVIDPQLLLLAYRSGIFPMAETRDDPEIMWIEPRERAIFPLDGLTLSRSLVKTLRRDRFTVTCNQAFEQVIAGCAAPRDGEDGDVSESWISHRITASYVLLHKLGHAHSVECWRDGQLVGGLYGVGFDRVFCGESMFSRESDASKVALCWLVAAMRAAGMELLDCQFMTSHLASLGAVAMPQARYLEMVARACRPVEEAPYRSLPQGFQSLAGASSSPGKVIAQSLIQTS
ncbi:leucyl/phenylalanyl-tRNA--protein transferase [Croceicoccus bisphenolivorans]|uniref:leucyl/phenylalanyl-tRNA--protein transferase n=1 Tax=Croceicoccus bisphenolivorans TaxID=1783232 RepID=UPI00082BD1EF|nr:leucyl/phenylalanyl-tRNA--protein transferase [Croceicoccus bisphenolivorans]